MAVERIHELQSGTPLSISANNVAGIFGAGRSQQQRQRPRLSGPSTTGCAVFRHQRVRQPAAFTFGNEPIFSPDLRSHGVRNCDLSFFKDFTIRSGVRRSSASRPSTRSTACSFRPEHERDVESFGIISGRRTRRGSCSSASRCCGRGRAASRPASPRAAGFALGRGEAAQVERASRRAYGESVATNRPAVQRPSLMGSLVPAERDPSVPARRHRSRRERANGVADAGAVEPRAADGLRHQPHRVVAVDGRLVWRCVPPPFVCGGERVPRGPGATADGASTPSAAGPAARGSSVRRGGGPADNSPRNPAFASLRHHAAHRAEAQEQHGTRRGVEHPRRHASMSRAAASISATAAGVIAARHFTPHRE